MADKSLHSVEEASDKLYRRWIIPSLKLEPQDEAFLKRKLHLKNTSLFFSHPGNVFISLPPEAPIFKIATLPSCMLRGNQLFLCGPKKGGILLPVQDEDGFIDAFQVYTGSLSNFEPSAISWWSKEDLRYRGASPAYFNVVKGQQVPYTIVLTHGLSSANAVADHWNCTGINPTGNLFELDYLHLLLTELEYEELYLYAPIRPDKNEALKLWELMENLNALGHLYKVLVPVLDDTGFPREMDRCTALNQQDWLNGLPSKIQKAITGSKLHRSIRNRTIQLERSKTYLAQTLKISRALNLLSDAKIDIHMNEVGAQAGLSDTLLKKWMKQHEITSTQSLKVKIDELVENARQEIAEEDGEETLPLFQLKSEHEAFNQSEVQSSAEVVSNREIIKDQESLPEPSTKPELAKVSNEKETFDDSGVQPGDMTGEFRINSREIDDTIHGIAAEIYVDQSDVNSNQASSQDSTQIDDSKAINAKFVFAVVAVLFLVIIIFSTRPTVSGLEVLEDDDWQVYARTPVLMTKATELLLPTDKAILDQNPVEIPEDLLKFAEEN
ncbi:MAG: hypothetical protein MK193_10690 [Lentisphaeria bacterium]|nr:hypothetical protein [Lentisphaeria bacterium]